MSKSTQRRRILDYCAEHGSITVREAVLKLNINSPTKRFSELKQMGFDIRTEKESRINSDGYLVRYNRYFVKEASDG